MREKNNKIETVAAEAETSAAVETVAEVTPEVTETVIPAPVEVEVVAETPKPVVPVIEVVQRKTPPDQRRYKLIRRPSTAPKGNQRIIVLHLLIEALKAGKTDISAEEMVDAANSLHYHAEAGTLASIRWHLHQMKLAGFVQLTNETYSVEVEKVAVTPAEIMPITKDSLAAQIAKLQEQLNKL